jgi:transglutaminase-like putative cysteine protease
MRYRARHVTRYQYEEPVSQCFSEARLTPRSTPRQRVIETKIHVHPDPDTFDRREDYFGNDVASFSVFRIHDRFITTAESVVEVEQPAQHSLPAISWEGARRHLALHPDAESLAAYEFRFGSPFIPAGTELAEYARPTFPPGRPLAEAVQELSHRIHDEFLYQPKSTSIEMPLLEVLRQRRGVCQDFSHVMIGALRSLRLAARYVSGYLRSGDVYQGAGASHAWVAVFIPGYGWLDLDPTNDVLPGEGHVTVAWGRDYGDVTPVRGIALGGGKHSVEVDVSVVPSDHLPPPATPTPDGHRPPDYS